MRLFGMRRPLNATLVNGVWIPNPKEKISITPIANSLLHMTHIKKPEPRNSVKIVCQFCSTLNHAGNNCSKCGRSFQSPLRPATVVRTIPPVAPYVPIATRVKSAQKARKSAQEADAKRLANEQEAEKKALDAKKKKIKPPPANTTEEVLEPLHSESETPPVPEVPSEKTTEEKKEDKKKKMKRWPENVSELLPYKDIVNPLKEIVRQGYRLWRKDEVKTFEYEGYNIGKQELQSQPPPNVRLSEKFLEHEKKSGHTLMDVVLNVMFLMGVEQGRRAERRDMKPVEILLQTLEIYREKNKNQRIRIDELEVVFDLKENFPNLSPEKFQQKLKEGLNVRRAKRIEELKAELMLDASRSAFQFKSPSRSKFKELETLAKSLTKETCTEEQWKHILKERGWTYKEWQDRCKKKDINIEFS